MLSSGDPRRSELPPRPRGGNFRSPLLAQTCECTTAVEHDVQMRDRRTFLECPQQRSTDSFVVLILDLRETEAKRMKCELDCCPEQARTHLVLVVAATGAIEQFVALVALVSERDSFADHFLRAKGEHVHVRDAVTHHEQFALRLNVDIAEQVLDLGINLKEAIIEQPAKDWTSSETNNIRARVLRSNLGNLLNNRPGCADTLDLKTLQQATS